MEIKKFLAHKINLEEIEFSGVTQELREVLKMLKKKNFDLE
jgi:hypothetical protein